MIDGFLSFSFLYLLLIFRAIFTLPLLIYSDGLPFPSSCNLPFPQTPFSISVLSLLSLSLPSTFFLPSLCAPPLSLPFFGLPLPFLHSFFHPFPSSVISLPPFLLFFFFLLSFFPGLILSYYSFLSFILTFPIPSLSFIIIPLFSVSRLFLLPMEFPVLVQLSCFIPFSFSSLPLLTVFSLSSS